MVTHSASLTASLHDSPDMGVLLSDAIYKLLTTPDMPEAQPKDINFERGYPAQIL